MTESTAVAVPEKWTEEVQKYERENYIVLAPRQLGPIPQYHTPVLSVVEIDPSEDGGDIYPLPGGQKVALTKTALDRVSMAADITWIPQFCRRTDDGSDPDRIVCQAVGKIKTLSGEWRSIPGDKELVTSEYEKELRESVPRRKWITDIADPAKRARAIEETIEKDLGQYRKHRHARCMSGAMNNAIKRALGIKSGYTKAELAKAKNRLVVPKIVFTPDYDDPVVKQHMLAVYTDTVKELYGAGPAKVLAAELPPALPPAPDEPDDTPPPGPAGGASSSGNGGRASEDRAAGDTPPPPDSVLLFTENYAIEGKAGSPEIKAEAIKAQVEALEVLAKRKGYEFSRLTKPLTEFSRQQRHGFFEHLKAMPDVEQQAALPWG
jgi:hypothetical protein